MKILLISDYAKNELWNWSPGIRERLSGVSLILSAGDLPPEYLEFLVTMMNVPLLYVRGNHDSCYDERPPEGCIDIDGRVAEVRYDEAAGRTEVKVLGRKRFPDLRSCLHPEAGEAAGDVCLRIAGLGGCMRYRKGKDLYTEREMARRVRKLTGVLLLHRVRPDLLLTHAPSFGHGDMTDLAHTGFACFNIFLERFRPSWHCYGHVHLEYGRFRRITQHPAGTTLINCCGYHVLEIG